MKRKKKYLMKRKNNFNINCYQRLNSLKYPILKKIACNIRKKIISIVSKNGGHLSSNLGVIELTIALHRNFDFTINKLLFDIGHQTYTHKILTGRNLNNLRKKDGISGFIKTNESLYDIFEAGHSSTSLSAALAFAIDRDNKKKKYEVICVIGDASIINGVAFEALNHIAYLKHKVIIIINDNGMGINKTISNIFIKKNTTKNFFTNLNFEYIGVINGHNFKDLDEAFNEAKKKNKSVLIHVKTIKGKGFLPAEKDKYGYWHKVDEFDKKAYTYKLSSKNKNDWTNLYNKFIDKKLKKNKNFYFICPGTLYGKNLENLIKKYPNNIIDTGISEEHAIILAGQLAKLGYQICVSICATFLQRGFDQLIHDIARINASVVFLVEKSGFTGNDGDTHQGIYDMPFLMSIPNVNIVMARTINDAFFLFNKAFLNQNATFIKLPLEKINEKDTINKKKYQFKSFYVFKKKNSKNAIISIGPLTTMLLKELKNITIDVYNPIILKPIDKNLIIAILKYEKIVIYNPYETNNGFVNTFINEIILKNFKGKIIIKTIPEEFIAHMSINEQLKKYHLLPSQIKNIIYRL